MLGYCVDFVTRSVTVALVVEKAVSWLEMVSLHCQIALSHWCPTRSSSWEPMSLEARTGPHSIAVRTTHQPWCSDSIWPYCSWRHTDLAML